MVASLNVGRAIVQAGLGAVLGFVLGLALDSLLGPLSLALRRGRKYPVLEIISALLLAAASLLISDGSVALLVGAHLVVVAAAGIVDARNRIIPNRLMLPSLVIFAAWIAVLDWLGDDVSLIRGLLGLLVLGGGLLAVSFVSPRGMGMGDVKLGGLIGLVTGALGWRYLAVATFIGVLTGGLAGMTLLLAGRGRKATLPFGPYLAVGAIIAALLAPDVARWYGDLLQ